MDKTLTYTFHEDQLAELADAIAIGTDRIVCESARRLSIIAHLKLFASSHCVELKDRTLAECYPSQGDPRLRGDLTNYQPRAKGAKKEKSNGVD